MVPLAERSMWSKNSFLERGTAFEKTVRLNSKFVQKCSAFLERLLLNFQFRQTCFKKDIFCGIFGQEHTIFKISDFQKCIFGTRCAKNTFWYKIDFL